MNNPGEKPAGNEGGSKRKNKGKKKKKDQKGYTGTLPADKSTVPETAIETDSQNSGEPKPSTLKEMFHRVANSFGKGSKKKKSPNGDGSGAQSSSGEKSSGGPGTSSGSDAGPPECKSPPREAASGPQKRPGGSGDGASEPDEPTRAQRRGRGRGRTDQKPDGTVVAEVHATPPPVCEGESSAEPSRALDDESMERKGLLLAYAIMDNMKTSCLDVTLEVARPATRTDEAMKAIDRDVAETDGTTKEFETETGEIDETRKALDRDIVETGGTTEEFETETAEADETFVEKVETEITENDKTMKALDPDFAEADETTEGIETETVKAPETTTQLDQEITETDGTTEVLDRETADSDPTTDGFDTETVTTLKTSANFDQETSETDENTNDCDTESTKVSLETADSDETMNEFRQEAVEREVITKEFNAESVERYTSSKEFDIIARNAEETIEQPERETAKTDVNADEFGRGIADTAETSVESDERTSETGAPSAKESKNETAKTDGTTGEPVEQATATSAKESELETAKTDRTTGEQTSGAAVEAATEEKPADPKKKKKKKASVRQLEVVTKCQELLDEVNALFSSLGHGEDRGRVRAGVEALVAMVTADPNAMARSKPSEMVCKPPEDFTLEKARPVIRHRMHHSEEEILRMLYYVQGVMYNQQLAARKQLYFTAERVLYALSNWDILDVDAREYEVRRLVFVYVAYSINEEFAHRVLEYNDYTRDIAYVPVLERVRNQPSPGGRRVYNPPGGRYYTGRGRGGGYGRGGGHGHN